MRKKCKNCKSGVVSGGFHKRIKQEVTTLEYSRDRDLNKLQEGKDKAKYQETKKKINKEYDLKLEKIGQQTARLVSNCCYCNGEGYRKVVEI